MQNALVLLASVTWLAATFFIRGTTAAVTCAQCPTETKSLITKMCNDPNIIKVFPLDSCIKLVTGNTDADITTKVCEPLGICGTTFVSCVTCIDKVKAVVDTLCDGMTGTYDLGFFQMPLSSMCKGIASKTPDSEFTDVCKPGGDIVKTTAWGYATCNGPANWAAKGYAPTCTGNTQSPIDLDSTAPAASLLAFSAAYTKPTTGKVTNNGRTLVFTFDDASLLSVTSQLLNSHVFRPAEINFHWGSVNERGSEHVIDHKPFAMEMQIIHYNTKYANMWAALGKPDGILILAFLFKVDAANAIDSFKPQAEKIIAAPNQFLMKEAASVNLDTYLKAVDLTSFYTYTGSLTAPACNENVKWFVFDKVLTTSQANLDVLRKLKNHDWVPNVDNYRFPQPLGTRTVTRYKGA